jgi:cell division protein ZapA
METLDISLLGKEYRVSWPAEDKDNLLHAVAWLDERFKELGGKTHAGGETLAVMTALNLAHEFLQFQHGNGFDLPVLKRRIGLMQARLDGVLARQEKLF